MCSGEGFHARDPRTEPYLLHRMRKTVRFVRAPGLFLVYITQAADEIVKNRLAGPDEKDSREYSVIDTISRKGGRDLSVGVHSPIRVPASHRTVRSTQNLQKLYRNSGVFCN